MVPRKAVIKAAVIKMINGTVQPPVLSAMVPRKSGPVEATIYPTDWAMPDNCADSIAEFVRRTKNIMAKLNAVPAPTPVNTRKTIIKWDEVKSVPNKPKKNNNPALQPSSH